MSPTCRRSSFGIRLEAIQAQTEYRDTLGDLCISLCRYSLE